MRVAQISQAEEQKALGDAERVHLFEGSGESDGEEDIVEADEFVNKSASR